MAGISQAQQPSTYPPSLPFATTISHTAFIKYLISIINLGKNYIYVSNQIKIDLCMFLIKSIIAQLSLKRASE